MSERLDRISTGKAAAICGYTAKTMRKLAEAGKIPGAAFLGNNWRFDERRLRDWIRREEAACLQKDGAAPKTSSREMGSGTQGLKFAGAMSDAAYEQALGLKPKSGGRRC